MNQIDHDPDEPPRDRTGNWPYWAGIIMLAVLWAGSLMVLAMDWHSVILGALTGGVLVGFMMEYTGNKVPRWMRR